MTPLDTVVLALGLLIGTSLGALLFMRAGRIAQAISVVGIVGSCLLGLFGALQVLTGGPVGELSAAWQVPGAAFVVGIDSLSAFFLVPLFALAPLVAVFGRAYLEGHEDARRVGAASAVLGLLVAAMALVLLARHAMLLLVAWEAMALLAYLLISREHGEAEVRRAGWSYLVASHVGVLALVGLFLSLGSHAGGALDFSSFQHAAYSKGATLSLLALALVGFGIKAGVLGLHVWLPEAHAAAPSHVSALMSGVLVKLGVYGMLRVMLMLGVPEAAGVALMSLGLAGALIGISLALQQRDLKRALAYSTIENVGIVLFGLGLGFWARSRGDVALAALGFGGSLLHVWNHCAIKGLLFLGSGSVLHAAGTKDLEQLGGLLRRMPLTGASMMLGAAAIAGLLPLNGFVGEWLIYRGLAAAALGTPSWAGLAAMGGIAALALVGGLATFCFVRLVGVALLGQARSEGARRAHEPGHGMVAPIVVLAAGCVALSLAAPGVLTLAAHVVRDLCAVPGAELAVRSALAPLASFNLGLFALLLVALPLFAYRIRVSERDETWGCGYTAPSAAMQYSASSFAELLVSRAIPRWLRPRTQQHAPHGPFPDSAAWSAQHEDPLTRALYEPLLNRWGDRFSRLRWLQQGRLHFYLMYIAGIAVLALFWSAVRRWWVA